MIYIKDKLKPTLNILGILILLLIPILSSINCSIPYEERVFLYEEKSFLYSFFSNLSENVGWTKYYKPNEMFSIVVYSIDIFILFLTNSMRNDKEFTVKLIYLSNKALLISFIILTFIIHLR